MNEAQRVFHVVIADSQFLITESMNVIFGAMDNYSLTAVATSRFELGKAFEEEKIDLLIADFMMVDFVNAAEFKTFLYKYPDVKLLVMCNQLSKADFVELGSLGFKNIITKTIEREDFYSAVEATMRGRSYYSAELMEMMMEMNVGRQSLEETKALTASELEIVKLISQGLTTKEIAEKKHISFHTVNTHRKNIFRKMEVSNVSELVMTAIKAGWIDTIEYYI